MTTSASSAPPTTDAGSSHNRTAHTARAAAKQLQRHVDDLQRTRDAHQRVGDEYGSDYDRGRASGIAYALDMLSVFTGGRHGQVTGASHLDAEAATTPLSSNAHADHRDAP